MLLRRHKTQKPIVVSEAPAENVGASTDEPMVEETQEQNEETNEITVKEIKEQLDAKGIKYNPRAKKEDLLALLEAN